MNQYPFHRPLPRYPFALAVRLALLALLACAAVSTAAARERTLIDSSWRFQLGDPPDVTTNITVYPEISDLAKLQVADVDAEMQLEAIRPDPVATHAGENVSFVRTNYDDGAWRVLNLPHDWVVELGFDSGGDGSHGFKATSGHTIGWYRRTFTLPSVDAGKVLWLEFDGIYRNALIWFNGHCIGRDVSGYAPIHFEVTPYVNPGGTNLIVVRVDASRNEGWFYEGAGIYRHVWLVTTDPVHVEHWGTFVATTSLSGSNATLTVQTTVTNQSSLVASGSLTSTIRAANSNAVTAVTTPVSLAPGVGLTVTQVLAVANANLWSLDTPYLYDLVSTVSNQSSAVDIYETPFGVRTVSFSPTNGVFINGSHVEIQGMCNHQDHAGVGSALPDRLQYYRIERLKDMGVNAYRTSHNAPTPELLDACDRLGMLVLDETRRVGYDPEALGQLERMIRRDRNHPSVFCWSLGNEEWSVQGTSAGTAVMQAMQNLAHSLDPTRLCTAALNGSWGGSQGFSRVLDVQGFNYNLGSLDSYHAGHSSSNIIGTEVASTVTTRGIYADDAARGYVKSYDIQNSGVGWGEAAETWWPFYHARPWSSGGFVWTGFDYRGEPTPYGWPCINSHFGIMDTCGFPKDLFYYYQANWSDKSVLHIFPHWNWAGREGQPINVWAFGNCDAVELFLNGASQGRQALDVLGHVAWNVPYAPGTLEAVGYRHGRPVITNVVETTGTPAAIALQPDRHTILADGRDVSVVTVKVVDAQGRVVPTATNLVNFALSGGAIIGVGNGNPSSHEPDKASQRSVFNGLAEVIVQSTNQPGNILLTATSPGLVSTSVTITAETTLPAPDAPQGVTAIAGDEQVTIGWDVAPGAFSYNLKRSPTNTGPFTLVARNLGTLGFVDTGVTNRQTYYYVVSAVNPDGTSPDSTEVAATPEAVVTGLTAAVGTSYVRLQWDTHSGATGYVVKRSPASGGPYPTITSNLTVNSFIDTEVAPCQTYYYVVTATIGDMESAPSSEVAATVPGPLPSGLQSTDIGSVAVAGNASHCGGQYTVAGSGADIWNTADAFHFVYAPMNGDGEVIARVVSLDNTHSNAKGGVMIRESLTAGSRQMLVDVTPGVGIEAIRRTITGGSSSADSAAGAAPYWVRLTRTGSVFQAYFSADGSSWSVLGSARTISMASDAYAGLAVNSHNNGVLCSAVFDNVFFSSLNSFSNPPAVLQNPANATRYVNGAVTFSAAFTGGMPLNYEWRRDGVKVSSGSANSLTIQLPLSDLTPTQAGSYTLYVTNAYGFTNTAAATLAVLEPIPGTYAELITTNSPLAYWRLNDTGTPPVAVDMFGGNDLANTDVVAVQGVQGYGYEANNLAAGYNGTSSGSQATAPLMKAMTKFTLCGWFKAAAMPQPSRTALFGQNDLAELGFHNGGALGIWVAGSSGNGTLVTNSTVTLQPNTWYFVAASADGTNINLYLDGNLLGRLPGTMSDVYNSTDPFRIGYAVLDASGNYFSGAIDEVALFDHPLTGDQIQRLYAAAFAVPSVPLSARYDGTRVVLTWPGGTLQSAGEVAGVYTNVPGATSPYTNAPANPKEFFRVLVR